MITYNVRLKIKDENSKNIEKYFEEYVSEIKFIMYVHNIDVLGDKMKRKHDEIMARLPKGYKVYLSALRYNSIADSWIEVAAYYGDEKRFVVFT